MGSIPAENILSLSTADAEALASQMRPFWDQWVAKADAAGMPGQEILDEAVRLTKLYDQN